LVSLCLTIGPVHSLFPFLVSKHKGVDLQYCIFYEASYGCETWSLTWREQHRMRMFMKGCWGRYVGLRARKWQENGENCIMWSFMNLLLIEYYLALKWRRMRWIGHVARTEEKTNTYVVWWRSLKERDHLEDWDRDGIIILKFIFKYDKERRYLCLFLFCSEGWHMILKGIYLQDISTLFNSHYFIKCLYIFTKKLIQSQYFAFFLFS